MDANCSVCSEDKTYARGSMVEPEFSKLSVDLVEIWGLGTMQNIQN